MFGYPIWEKLMGYIGYRYSMNDVKDILPTAPQEVKDQAGATSTSGIILSLSRDTTDDTMFPTTGSRHRMDLNFAGLVLGGDNSYGKYNYGASWFFKVPPFGEDLVFSPRWRIGYIQAFEDKEIPVYELYLLGGINSIRGLKDVGVTDPVTGAVIGGNRMLLFNFEFIFPILKNAGMKGVVFFDTGNAWNNTYDLSDMRKTAGAGIRWYSPVGPLRLEWGYVLDPKPGEPAYRWDFTMGWTM
jgi:outer membrane protein insertion porin family